MSQPPPEHSLDALLAEAPFLQRLARSLCISEADSEDLIQETWLSILRKPPGALPNPRGWLANSLRSRASNRRRAERRAKRKHKDGAREETTPSNVREVEGLEVQTRLLDSVNTLPHQYREVVWLRFYEQQSAVEIAEHLGIPESTVRTRLARGLDRLRQKLDSETPGGRSHWMSALTPLGLSHPSAPVKVTGMLSLQSLSVLCGVILSAVLGMMIYSSMGSPDPTTHAASSLAAHAMGFDTDDSNKDEEVAGALPPGEVKTRTIVEPPQKPKKEKVKAECFVFGVIKDGAGKPIPGVQIRLRSYGKWREGADDTLLSGGPSYFGWDVYTDEEGRYRLEVPLPTAKAISMIISATPYQESRSFAFGGRSRSAIAPLVAGERDLGLMRLLATGAISGTVRDEYDNPVAGVTVNAGQHPSSLLGLIATTDSMGRYRVGHVLPGSHKVSVHSEKHLIQTLEAVQVSLRRETTGQNFRLASAPTIKGQITNTLGEPLGGAKLVALAPKHKARSHAYSQDDGHFTIYLSENTPHIVRVQCQGYQPYGFQVRKPNQAPGTKDLKIVLDKDVETRFLVIDEKTEEPIEQFGMRIDRNKGEADPISAYQVASGIPQASQHVAGIYTTGARPFLDWFAISAPGYLRILAPVSHDEDEPGTQTIRMSRGDRFTGLVTLDGRPVEGARVRFTPIYITRGEVIKTAEHPSGTRLLEAVVYQRNEALVTRTRENGTFAVDGVRSGRSYQVDINPKSPTCARILAVAHTGRGAMDLGELALKASASIQATVKAPPGIITSTVTFYLDDPKDGDIYRPDKNGDMIVANVGPGKHVLTLKDQAQGLLGGATWEVDLTAGKTLEILLDTRNRALCTVKANVALNGVPNRDLSLWVQSKASTTGTPTPPMKLGDLDANGFCEGYVLACGPARFLLRGVPGQEQVRSLPDKEFVLTPGSAYDIDLIFALGSLHILMPKDLILPEAGTLSLLVGDQAFELPIKGGALQSGTNGAEGVNANEILLETVPAGKQIVRVRVSDHALNQDDAQVFEQKRAIRIKPKKRNTLKLKRS